MHRDTSSFLPFQVLAEHGVTTIAALRQQDPLRIEVVRGFAHMQPTVPDDQQMLNRKPPFGLNVIAAVKQLPQYTLRVVETGLVTHKAQGPVEVELEVECGMIVERDAAPMKKNKARTSDMTLVLTVTSELDFIDFRRIP